MSLRDIIDFSTFTDLSTAFDLYSNSIRRAFSYDSYGNKTKFRAVVLTNPIPVSPSDLKYFTGTPEDKTSKKFDRYVYRARILGANSPHEFLPNPCDATYAIDPDQALKVIEMHTLFISDVEFGTAESLPRINTVVEVELEKNTFGYNLQYGKHIKVSYNDDKPSTSTSVSCDSIKSIMDSAAGVSALGSTTASTDGKPGNYDKPPFTKCSPSAYPSLEERARKWTKPTEEERIAAVKKVAPEQQIAATMLTIMSLEQPVSVGMPDYNPAGIQGDNRRWNEKVNSVVAYQTCIRDHEKYRIFLAFNTLEDGITAFKEALSPKGIPASTGDIDQDAYNLTKWYYQNWNLAATDEEIKQLEKTGSFERNGTTYERSFKLTRATFKKGLEKFATPPSS
jgi:hypothetical protein